MGLCFSRDFGSDCSSEMSDHHHHKVEAKQGFIAVKEVTETKGDDKNPTKPTKTVKRQPKTKSGHRRTSGKANKKAMLGGTDNKWENHQKSMAANTAERKIRKQRVNHEYDLDDLRRGAIVWEKRQGLYPDQIEAIEDDYENAVKKNRRLRRIRKIDESREWSLF